MDNTDMRQFNINEAYTVTEECSDTKYIIEQAGCKYTKLILPEETYLAIETLMKLKLECIPEIYAVELSEGRCEVYSRYYDDCTRMTNGVRKLSIVEAKEAMTKLTDTLAAYHANSAIEMIRPRYESIIASEDGRYIFTDYASVRKLRNDADSILRLRINDIYYLARIIELFMGCDAELMEAKNNYEKDFKQILFRCKDLDNPYPDAATLLYDLEHGCGISDNATEDDIYDRYHVISEFKFEKDNISLVRSYEDGLLYIRKKYSRDSVEIEAYRILQELKPEGVPEIKEVIETSADTVIVIEKYINAVSLAYMYRASKASAAEVRAIMLGICKVMEQLQGEVRGIVEKDVTPSNILIGENRVYLVDHNAAKVYDSQNPGRRDKSQLGTFGYAGPEIVYDRPSYYGTDIFGIGTTMKYCLGFNYDYDEELPEAFNDIDLISILRKCLELGEDKRYRNAASLEMDLQLGYGTYDKKQKRKNFLRSRKGKTLITVVILGLVMAAFGLGILANRYSYDPERDVRIKLSAENITVGQYEKALPIIRERLDLFAGKGNYELADDGTLSIPRECFHSYSYIEGLKFFITRPEVPYIEVTDTDTFNWHGVKLELEDIENVSVEYGSIDDADIRSLDITDDEYYYLVITLANGVMDELDRTMDGCDTKYSIKNDIEDSSFSNHYSHDIARSNSNPNVFYMVAGKDAKNLCEVEAYNLTHEGSGAPVSVSELHESLANWEKVSDTENPGKNQVNASDIKGDYYIAAFRIDADDDGEVISAVDCLKKRLDIIGDKYAIGTYKITEVLSSHLLTAKIASEHINEELLRLLSDTYSVQLFSPDGNADVTLSHSDVKPQITEDNGYYQLHLKLAKDSYREEEFNWFAGYLDKKNTDKVFLKSDHCILAQGTLNKTEIVIDKISDGNEGIDSEEKWILEMIADTYIGESNYIGLIYDTCQLSSESVAGGIATFYGDDTARMAEEIKALDKEVSVNATTGEYTVNLGLDSASDDYEETVIKRLDRILDIVQFKNSPLDGVVVFPDAGGDDRIIVEKNYASEQSDIEYNENKYEIYYNGRNDINKKLDSLVQKYWEDNLSETFTEK